MFDILSKRATNELICHTHDHKNKYTTTCCTVARFVEALALVHASWPISGSILIKGLIAVYFAGCCITHGGMLMLLNVTSYNTIGRTVLFNHGVNARVRTKSIIIPRMAYELG